MKRLRYLAPNLITLASVLFGLLSIRASFEGAYADAAWFIIFAVLTDKLDGFVARLKGVADRNAAERLTNIKLYVPRDRLPPVEDDNTFYHADLIGLAAVTPDGDAIGTVTAIHNFGAGDLIVIAKPDGEALMLPFTHAAVPTVDLKAGRIVVVPPAIVE